MSLKASLKAKSLDLKAGLRAAGYPVLGALLVLLAACESQWEKMPDHELAEKASECLYMNSPGAAQIQVCKNYKRECERRREMGIYVC